MADPHHTMPVLPPDLVVEGLEQIHERFLAFLYRIRLHLRPPARAKGLSYDKKRIVSQLAKACYERRLRQAGLSRVPEKEQKEICAFARSGGRLIGPTTRDEVDLLVARLHDESPWMAE